MERAARYYDENTRWFHLWERRNGPVAVHRRVHGPGVRTQQAALDYVHRMVARVARAMGAAAVVDLGCGTGALLCYLRNARIRGRLMGVTASTAQALEACRWCGADQRAIRRRHREGSGSPMAQMVVRCGDYLDPDVIRTAPGPRLYVAIESMVHASSARDFLSAVASVTRSGDELLICDDFLQEEARERQGRGARPTGLIRLFRNGWRASALTSITALAHEAALAGWEVVRTEEWTEWTSIPGRYATKLFRLVSWMTAPVAYRPFFGNLSGGAALRAGYGEGVFRYLVTRLRRVGP